MSATPPDRLTRLARPLFWLCTVTMVAFPLLTAYAAATGAMTEARLRTEFAHLTLPETIPTPGWAAVFGVAGISVALALAALSHMRALFALYAAGSVLGFDAARHIHRIGQAVLALAVVGVLGDSIIALALTAGNAPGQRALSIMLGSDDLFLALAAGLLIVIGWAMAEAARVAEDNAGFV